MSDQGAPTQPALLICALAFVIKGFTSGWSLVAAMFLFPAFLVLVSALSVTGRWDLYVWHRGSMGFVAFDTDASPIGAKLWQLLSVVMLVFFLICFFLYDPATGTMSWQYQKAPTPAATEDATHNIARLARAASLSSAQVPHRRVEDWTWNSSTTPSILWSPA